MTILMPCLNEAETLRTCIEKAKRWLGSSGVNGEVLIADNGSEDGSQLIAGEHGARVISVLEKGYGAALYAGSKAALGKYVIMGDADDSYNFEKLDLFLEHLRRGHHLVMGNRFKGGIAQGAMPWKNRWIGNPVLSFLGRILFRVPIRDFHCGLRGFSKKSFEEMDLRTTGMEYASEMVIKARLLNMKISEVATTLSKDGRSRPPHLRPWRDGWRHLKFMFSMSPTWLFILPGALISLASLPVYGALVSGPVSFGPVILGANSLFLTQTALILGLVTLVMGFSLRVFATRDGLLPANGLTNWLLRSQLFESGSLVGVGFFVFGLMLSIDALNTWADLGFGQLPTDSLLRQVSLSSTLMLVGGILTSASLLLGFLSIPKRRT